MLLKYLPSVARQKSEEAKEDLFRDFVTWERGRRWWGCEGCGNVWCLVRKHNIEVDPQLEASGIDIHLQFSKKTILKNIALK